MNVSSRFPTNRGVFLPTHVRARLDRVLHQAAQRLRGEVHRQADPFLLRHVPHDRRCKRGFPCTRRPHQQHVPCFLYQYLQYKLVPQRVYSRHVYPMVRQIRRRFPRRNRVLVLPPRPQHLVQVHCMLIHRVLRRDRRVHRVDEVVKHLARGLVQRRPQALDEREREEQLDLALQLLMLQSRSHILYRTAPSKRDAQRYCTPLRSDVLMSSLHCSLRSFTAFALVLVDHLAQDLGDGGFVFCRRVLFFSTKPGL